MRRYWCKGCKECKNFDFLKCLTKDCGKWSFHKFKLKKRAPIAKQQIQEVLQPDIKAENKNTDLEYGFAGEAKRRGKANRRPRGDGNIHMSAKKQKLKAG